MIANHRKLLHALQHIVLCLGLSGLAPLTVQTQQQPIPIPDGWIYGYPQYYTGLIYANWSWTYETWGSGTVVLPRAVITAGHVLYNKNTQSWAPLVAFMRWNHGGTGWPSYNPEKWNQSVAPHYKFRMINYTGNADDYTSFNQDLGGMVFNAPLLPNSWYMQIKAANPGNTTPVYNSTLIVRQRLEGGYQKSIMCYPTGRYAWTSPTRYKMHETLPQGFYLFHLPAGIGAYDSVGMPTMWYRSMELRANGLGCSGGSIQQLITGGRVLLGVVITDSPQHGLGVRGLNSSGIALVHSMSLY